MSTDFPAALDRFADRCRGLATAATSRAAAAVRDAAVARTPVASGRLRDGWRIAPGDPVRVVNDVPYAAAVEYGTRDRPARPMARPAALEVAVAASELAGDAP